MKPEEEEEEEEEEEGRVPLAENKITHQRAQPFNIVNSVEFNLNCYKNECLNSNITILIDCQCLIKLPHTYTNRFGCKQFSYAESKQFSYGYAETLRYNSFKHTYRSIRGCISEIWMII